MLFPFFFLRPHFQERMTTPHLHHPKGQGQDNISLQNSFPDLVELDAMRLTVIVDNEVDIMTSVPKELGLTTQAQVLFKDKRHLDKEKSTATATATTADHTHDHKAAQGENGPVRTIGFDFNDLCCGAHGLSILVVKSGWSTPSFLFVQSRVDCHLFCSLIMHPCFFHGPADWYPWSDRASHPIRHWSSLGYLS